MEVQKESQVGGTSPLNVNKAAEQGEMERKNEKCGQALMMLVISMNSM